MKVSIQMKDGAADAYIAKPKSGGPWPAVLFFMDAPGWRPTLFEMADRLASHGYSVLLPNLLWRAGDIAPFDPKTVFADDKERERLMKLVGSITNEMAMSDTETFLDFLAGQSDVREPGRIACDGYCMGGGFAISAACRFPDRIAAAASFHGGRFLTSPEAPDAIAGSLRARVYIGVAESDRSHTPEVTKRLTAALEKAKVPFTIETYAGTSHGFAVPDLPPYNREAAEKHWDRLLKLLSDTFGGSVPGPQHA